MAMRDATIAELAAMLNHLDEVAAAQRKELDKVRRR